MKTGIHPVYNQITVACACGNTFQVGTTMKDNLRVEICSNCHPLYTGKAKLVDTAGRVDKFRARSTRSQAIQAETQARVGSEAPKAEEPAAA